MVVREVLEGILTTIETFPDEVSRMHVEIEDVYETCKRLTHEVNTAMANYMEISSQTESKEELKAHYELIECKMQAIQQYELQKQSLIDQMRILIEMSKSRVNDPTLNLKPLPDGMHYLDEVLSMQLLSAPAKRKAVDEGQTETVKRRAVEEETFPVINNNPPPADTKEQAKSECADSKTVLVSEDTGDNPDGPYCICNQGEFGRMVACDNNCARQWFHFECMGMKRKPRGDWFCPECRELKFKQALQQGKQGNG